LNGVLILSSFMLLLYSSAFVFIKTDGMTSMYYLLMDMADKPKEMFAGELAYGFIFMIPAIPLANAPASILAGKATAPFLLLYAAAGVLFAAAAYISMKYGLRRYSSASG